MVSWSAVWRGLLVAATVTAAVPAQADQKKIVVDGKFGQVVSESVSKPGAPDDLELGQEVRVDSLTSADPDWDGATITLYEQNLSYPSHGSYRSYGLVRTKSGDTAYLQLEGKWDIVMRDGQFEAAPFEGSGRVIGGTGKLEGLSGQVMVKGKVDSDRAGGYSVEIISP